MLRSVCIFVAVAIHLSATGCLNKDGNSTSSPSTPRVPTIVGKLEVSDGSFFKVVKGNGSHLFAAAGQTLKVIDISTPSAPSIVASLTVPYSDWSANLDFDGSNTVYIANGGMGISSVDVSNLLSPTIIDTDNWDYGWTLKVKVSGNRAYVTKGNGGFRIYDISNPSNITLVSAVAGGGGSGAENFVLFGSTAILGFANTNKKFTVYDIATEATPSAGASYSGSDISDGVFEMAYDSGKLYVAAYSKGVKIFDVSDLTNPTLLKTIDPIGKVVNLTVSGEILYVLDDGIGLRTFNISNPLDPVPIDSLPLTLTGIASNENFITGITIDGDYAYVTSLEDGLYIIQWK